MRIFLACILAGVTLLATILAGCAISAPPQSIRAPNPPPTMVAPQVATQLTPEETAWEKVVDSAKKEGTVTAYSFSWVGDIGLEISKAFQKRYNINLEIITGRGAEFLERLKTEKRMRQQTADMTDGNSLHVSNMKLEGLLTSMADELPALKEKGVWLVEPTAIDQRDKMNLVFRLMTRTPYVNTKLVKVEEIPRSWKDLLDAKWKGKMSLAEPNISAGAYESIVVFMEYKVWDEDYIKALYKQGLFFPTGSVEEAQMLSRGDFFLSILGTDNAATRFAAEGAPIQAIDMREGVVVSTNSIAAIANSPHPNATRVFLNWLNSKEGMTTAGKALGQKMIRKDVPDYRPKGVQADMEKPLVLTVEQLDKATQLFRQKWFDKTVGR